MSRSEQEEYPSTKEIITLLGIGVLLVGSLVLPGLGVVAGQAIKMKRRYEYQQQQKEWKKFNQRLLRKNLRRLYEQKIIELIEENGKEYIKLTQKGRTKFLRFKLQDLSEKTIRWDGKWRLIIYDIEKIKNNSRNSFRSVLKQINCLALQKSVYITPLKCNESIEYLREYFGVSEGVLVLEVSKLENEQYYKQYFGL